MKCLYDEGDTLNEGKWNNVKWKFNSILISLPFDKMKPLLPLFILFFPSFSFILIHSEIVTELRLNYFCIFTRKLDFHFVIVCLLFFLLVSNNQNSKLICFVFSFSHRTRGENFPNRN